MKETWLFSILFVSFFLLATLKSHHLKTVTPFFAAEKVYKLKHFESAKKKITAKEIELLEIWESILTGRSAPISKFIKNQYKSLGLNHLFTPSGFHLSTILTPSLKLISNSKLQLILICLIGTGIFSLAGQGALKRMVLIKFNQKIFNCESGFIIGMLLDIIFGSFSSNPLSFSYSFLFVGIIYSKKSFLFFWFFFAQGLISYFNSEYISPLIILFSPLLNIAFGIGMPFLFLLAYPLYDWQLHLGLKILGTLQNCVEFSARIISTFPAIEFNIGVIASLFFFYLGKRRTSTIILLILSSTLNFDGTKTKGFGKYDFRPTSNVIKKDYKNDEVIVYFKDGRCKRNLIRGLWWERCSPFKKRKHLKTIKKSSYP